MIFMELEGFHGACFRLLGCEGCDSAIFGNVFFVSVVEMCPVRVILLFAGNL